MILTSHAIAGTIVSSMLPNHPIIGFGLALTSHYFLDMIPHWEYQLKSESLEAGKKQKLSWKNKTLYFDLAKISGDLVFGTLLSLVYLFLSGNINILVLCLGVVAGILPDLLQFAYIIFPKVPFLWTQKIHDTFHFPNIWKYKPWPGISIQIVALLTLAILVLVLS